MAVLFIAEFAVVEQNQNGQLVQAVMQPPLVEQTVAIGGASVQSAAFNAQTRIVRLHTDATCSIKFGVNPTATATTARMAAGDTEYFGVLINQAFKVAVIQNT